MPEEQIFVFIIDSMSSGDLKFIRKNKKKFPFINFMTENGVIYENCYSNSSPTEFVMPSFFSSSLPLDYETYQNGIKNRNLPEINKFLKRGFNVNIFTNSAMLTDLYNYRGDLNVKSFFSIEGTWRHFKKNYVWHFFNNPNYSYNLHKKIFKDIVIRFYKFFISYVEKDISSYSNKVLDIKKNKYEIIKSIKYHLKLAKFDFNKYFFTYLKDAPENSFLTFFYKRNFKSRAFDFFNDFFRDKDMNWKEGIFDFFNYEIKFDNVITPIGNMINNLKENNSIFRKKNINFIHCLDLHHDTIGDNFFINKISEKNKKVNSLINIDRKLQGFNQYLIYKKIKFKLILTSDHGSVDHKNSGPLKNNFSEGLFNNIFIKIPLVIFDNKNLTKKINNDLIGTKDILKVVYNNYFKNNLFKNNYLIAEHCSRGSGIINLLNKFFYVCIISKEHKLIYSNRLSKFDLSKMKKGYYLFKNNDNLYKKRIKSSKKDIAKMNNLLNNRIKFIQKKIKQLEYKWL